MAEGTVPVAGGVEEGRLLWWVWRAGAGAEVPAYPRGGPLLRARHNSLDQVFCFSACMCVGMCGVCVLCACVVCGVCYVFVCVRVCVRVCVCCGWRVVFYITIIISIASPSSRHEHRGRQAPQ